MLFLVFQLAESRYVIEARLVVEVLPLVEVKPLPQAPPWLAGLFDLRGTPLPLIDLSQLALGRPSRRCLSTRILLARCQDASGGSRLLGLIAERATRTLRCDPARFIDSGVNSDTAPYLGAVASDAGGLLQRIELERLLSRSMQALLCQSQEPA